MGEIKKQGISNSIIIMLGAIIGAVNVLFLFPKILPEAYFGLTRVLVELTYIFLQFGLVGGHSTLIRFWSRISIGSQLLRYILKYSILFSIIILSLLALFKNEIISFYFDKSPLLTEHYNSIFVLFISGLLFEIFASVSIGMLKTQVPTFLKEVVIRGYVSVIILSYHFKAIDETTFIYLFVLGYVFIGVGIMIYVLGKVNVLKKPKSDLLFQEKKEISKFRLASFFSAFSSGIVNRLDILMIAAMVSNDVSLNHGLKSVAIYSIALYTSTLIEIPSRGVFAISAPVISKFWATNEIDSIASVYKKSSINLFIVALFLFMLLMLNLDSLLSFLKESFLIAKPVILILGVSKVFNMLLGVNNIILSTSKYYLIGTYTMVGLIVLTFSLNYWLIPEFGLYGAAIGSLISLVIYNLISYFFLYSKFNMQPFSINTIKVIVIAFIAYYLTSFIKIENVYFSILSKTAIFSLLYLIPVYLFNVSDDINEVADKTRSRFFKNK